MMPTPATVHVVILNSTPERSVPWDSGYVEQFWLPLIGSTAWCVMRHVYEHVGPPGLDYELDVERLARCIGVQAGRAFRSFSRMDRVGLCARRVVTNPYSATDRRVTVNGAVVEPGRSEHWAFPRTVRLLDRRHVAMLPAFLREEALNGKA